MYRPNAAALSASVYTSTPLSTPTSEPALFLLSEERIETASERCTICNCAIGIERADGKTETAFILPCSHVFGSICIMRWLEIDSLHQDCPNCRRRMVYRGCGHPMKPCDAEKAPKCVAEKDMPEKCLRCRASEDLEGELRLKRERQLAEQRALEGMKIYLPVMFGGLARSTVQNVDRRIEDSRDDWRKELDAALSEIGERNDW